MKAISDALYFTTHMHESISKTLVQYAEKIIQLDVINNLINKAYSKESVNIKNQSRSKIGIL